MASHGRRGECRGFGVKWRLIPLDTGWQRNGRVSKHPPHACVCATYDLARMHPQVSVPYKRRMVLENVIRHGVLLEAHVSDRVGPMSNGQNAEDDMEIVLAAVRHACARDHRWHIGDACGRSCWLR